MVHGCAFIALPSLIKLMLCETSKYCHNMWIDSSKKCLFKTRFVTRLIIMCDAHWWPQLLWVIYYRLVCQSSWDCAIYIIHRYKCPTNPMWMSLLDACNISDVCEGGRIKMHHQVQNHVDIIWCLGTQKPLVVISVMPRPQAASWRRNTKP
jgi:hypothetical protein